MAKLIQNFRLSEKKINQFLKCTTPKGCSETLRNNFIHERAVNLNTSQLTHGSKGDTCILFSAHATNADEMVNGQELGIIPPNKLLECNILLDKKTAEQMEGHAFEMVVYEKLLIGVHLIPNGKKYEEEVLIQKQK